MAKMHTGRPSVFRDKKGGRTYQGLVTKRGSVAFELARKRLAKIVERNVETISDADVIEYLARGEDETRRAAMLIEG